MSRQRVEVRPAARRDLDRIVLWLRAERDAGMAIRFARAATRTFSVLAATLGLGPCAEAEAVELADARRWHVDGFNNYLIFYQPSDAGIAILRILHAAQDWKRR